MARIEIDEHSGFCFGVVTAIRKAEEELDRTGRLYCLGDIVHNSNEVERLKAKGLITIDHEQLKQLHDVKVLLRAHGEPPETYRIAAENNIEIIDATCPVVLQLQRKIKTAYDSNPPGEAQIVIYGKTGHAEVNGLVGQTHGKAVVIEGDKDLGKIDLRKKLLLYSQTTKFPPHRRRDKTAETRWTIRIVRHHLSASRQPHSQYQGVCPPTRPYPVRLREKEFQRTGAFRRMPASQSPIPTRFRHQRNRPHLARRKREHRYLRSYLHPPLAHDRSPRIHNPVIANDRLYRHPMTDRISVNTQKQA